MLDNGIPAQPHRQNGALQRSDDSGLQSLLLETISPESCDALNEAYAIRSVVGLSLGNRALSLSPVWLADEPVIAEAWAIKIDADDRQLDVILPQKLLELIIADLDPNIRLPALSDAIRPLLLEFALRSGLEALEAALGCALSIRSVSRVRSQAGSPEQVMLPFRIELERMGPSWCVLRIYPEQLRELVGYLSNMAEQDHPPVDLPLPVCVRWASVNLTLAELRSLAPGDIVLVDESCKQAGLAVAVIGEHLIAPLELLRNGYRVSGQPQRAAISGFEWSLNSQPHYHAAAIDAAPEQVPVRLFFEFGRFYLERSAVSQLKAGALLELARPLEEGLDLVAGGVRIGRGEVVSIGSAVGVRVIRLSNA